MCGQSSVVGSRSLLRACASVSVLLLAFARPAVAVEIDGIAARVDSAVILRSDVMNELRRIGASPERFTEVRNDMIDRKLILKAAKESKMTMQEWLVDNRIREIVDRSFDGDRNRLMDTLAKQKVAYPEWRDKIRDEMIVSAMRWQMVDKNVTASPAALRAEYENHPDDYMIGAKMTVSVILLDPEHADRRADVTAALATNDFADVARAYSADVHAKDGGVWKDVDPAEVLKPAVCARLSALKLGETSGWIELDGWYFLVRKDAESAERRMTFAEAFEDVEDNVKSDMAVKLYDEWIARLRKTSYVQTY